jgi:putative membrane protein
MIKRYALVWTLAAALAPATFAADQPSDAAGQQGSQSSQAQNPSAGAGQSSDQSPGAGIQSKSSDQNAAQPAGARQAGEQAQSPESNKEFVQNIASANQFEIQAGQMIQEKAQDQQIKDYAKQMVQDHQQAGDQLKPIAQAMGVDISSQQLNPVHQAKLQELQKKQGEDLEKCYIFGQAGMHLTQVLETSWRSQSASDPQLKQFLTQLQPKLQQHLQHAIQLSGGDMARLASERMKGSRAGEGSSVTGDATGTGSSGRSGQTGTGAGGTGTGTGAGAGGTGTGTGTGGGTGTGSQNP